MKFSSRKYGFGLGALLLLLLSQMSWTPFRLGPAPRGLAVALVGVQNDPLSHWRKGPTVLHGCRGLCAIFAVTNISTHDSLWFNTWALEQKVGAEWRRTAVPPYASRQVGDKHWFLLDSDDASEFYPPGRSWYYVVPWPADIPTNTAWRLEVRYGRAPSPFTVKMSDAFDFTRMFGFTLFKKRRADGTLLTPEVSQ